VNVEGTKDGVEKMLKILSMNKSPNIDIGPYCDNPYECVLKGICWKNIPKHSVFELGGSKKCWELYSRGIVLIKDIPSDVKLNSKMQIQLKTVKSGKPVIDKKVIKDFLLTLKPPLHYFDFETFSSAVPIYDRIRPFQRIPYQYSLHIVDKDVKHYAFLSLKNMDPRLELLENLKKEIKPEGSIIAYNAGFEKSVLNELAVAFPKYSAWIKTLIPRFVDLIDPFKNFDCYYSSQGSTASLKAVLPAFTGKDYSEMEVANGNDATIAYISVINGLIEESSVRSDMLKYCGQDTEGMIWIVDRLRKEAGK
jgi:hypothetical protein